MGRADNRKSLKMRRKKAQRLKNARIRKKIEAGAAATAEAPKAAPKKRPAGSTTTRKAVVAQPAT